jgi:GT2 family glycosyltransferase
VRKISFFESTHSPYYIYGLDFSQKSAGIRALHYLCHALSELGYEAYITCEITSPSLRTPRLTKRIQRRHEEAGRIPITVYPEIISGNPLNAAIVVRWLLNQPGHLSGDKYFEDSDLIFTYSAAFLPPELKGGVLHIPTIDTSIFNNKDNVNDSKRDLVCYYAKKYLAKGGQLTRHVQGATSLGQEVQLSHREIAAILRRSRMLYIYEPTALMNEALLCGCPVCVISTDYWQANVGKMEFAPDIGVAMEDTPEALAAAANTVANYASRFEKNAEWAWTQLRSFIKITQGRAAEYAKQLEVVVKPEAGTRLAHKEMGEKETPFQFSASQIPGSQVVIQIVICVPEGFNNLLASTLASLDEQCHALWQVIVISNQDMPNEYSARSNLRWLHQESGAARVLNELIRQGGFDWQLRLEAGDVLEKNALSRLIGHISMHPERDLIYADESCSNEITHTQHAYFKPDFSIDLLRASPDGLGFCMAANYVFLKDLSGYREDVEGAEHYDLVLRAFEKSGERGIGHISDVLCHRQRSCVNPPSVQSEALAARQRVLEEHLARIGAGADIEAGVQPNTFHIRYHHDAEVAVSIIIPTLNGGAILKASVNGVVENTEFKNWELIVVDQESDDPETLEFLAYLRAFENEAIRVISQPRSASFPAALNAGAKVARQDYLLFLSDSTQPLRGDWLDEMLGYAVQPGVGVVGAKGVGLDGTVSNAGYILGLEGRPAGFPEQHVALDAPGYFGRLQVPGNPSAVSFTCMLTEKKLFDELGGFDDQSLVGGYSDVDYCLKVGKVGRRIVWTPFAVVFQKHQVEAPEELASDDDEDDSELGRTWILPGPAGQTMFDRWLDRIAFDPAYNRNLSLCQHSAKDHVNGFDIETMTALTLDPDFRPVPRILALKGDFSGCAESRIVAPLRSLTGKVQSLEITTYLSIPELVRMSPDAIVFQRQINEEQVKLMELYARNTKAFRVYELDDLITNIQLRNRSRRDFQDKDLVKRFRQALDTCDRMVVATETLAQEYRKFKSDIRVVLNYVEQAKWGGLLPKRRRGRKPRVGWAGSNSHEGDLAIVADVVKALSDEVEWVFFGLCPEGVRQLVEYHAGVPVEHFPAKLASLDLDLAIAPLEDVPFNHAKSHLKLLEYGILGYPVICTDITPYRGDYPVTRVKSRGKDWVAAIREHISDMDELARRGDALREHVQENWLLENNSDAWLNAWLPN